MTIIEAILLGILQGITEFLPISSSGHLVLGQHILGVNAPGMMFEVILHLGSLISILVVFWPDLLSILTTLKEVETRKLIYTIIIGTIPAVVIGLLFKDWFESAFSSVSLVGVTLLFSGVILILTRIARPKNDNITIGKGLLIGIAQSLAITPGISRSGITIATALFLGIDGTKAARFSFLLAIPAITGAGLLTSLNLASGTSETILTLPIIAGFISSLIVGIISLTWLLKTLRSGKFHWFGIYCLLVGLITLLS